MKNRKATVVFGAIAGCALVSASALAFSPNDGLVYDLALVPTDGAVGTANLYDRLTHSAAVRKTAAAVPVFSGDTSVLGSPDPITITNRVGSIPYYSKKAVNNVVYTEPSLDFPQTARFNGSGALYTYQQGVKFSDIPVSSNMTVYGRIWLDSSLYSEVAEEQQREDVTVFDFERVDGNSTGSNPCYGLRLFVRRNNGEGFTLLAGFGYYGVASVSTSYTGTTPYGRWLDFALVVKTDAEAVSSTATCYSCLDGIVSARTVNFNQFLPGGQVLKFKSGNLSLGCDYSAVAATGWSAVANNKKTKRTSFRGGISRFRIFNRHLSAKEIHGLFTEANGGAVVIGTANGSADEFAAGDEAVEAYNPYEMATSRMRGRLTAAHPSLTIDCPSKGAVKGHHKRLAVVPVLDDLAGGSAIVDVAVNGVTVGSLNLANEGDRVLYIRGRNVDTNGTGCVRYTLIRRGNTTGTLGIDALEIAGEWQEGLIRSGNVPDVTKAFVDADLPQTYVGHPSATNYMQESIMGAKWDGVTVYRPLTAIEFYVPPEIAQNLNCRYTFCDRSSDYYAEGRYPSLDTYLNGVKFGETIPSVALGGRVVREIPAGTLNPGYNTILVSNATSFAEAKKVGGFAAIHIASHIFSFDPPKRGMMIIFR